ncbi:aminopeptidase [Salinarchaeum chitinilyticum]
MTDLEAPARTAIRDCLAVTSGESVAVVTDDERLPIGTALYDVASEVTPDATLVRYQPGDQHGAEPPEPVAGAMADSDVFVVPTTKSLSHTRARTRACEAGARGVTLPGITEDVFTTGLDADYESIARECEAMLDHVSGAEEIRITTELGTDFTVRPGSRTWNADTGLVHEPGDFSNLPAGEVFVSPKSASGTYVVDGTMMPHGLLESGETLRFEVEDGYVTEISDPAIREQVETAATEVGDAAYNLAELGIGTNLAVDSLVGSVLLDEKAAGTVHVAIGDDAGIGGDTDAPLHLDGIIRDPTVYVDGEQIGLPSP